VGQRRHGKSREYKFLYGKENENHQLRTGFLYTTYYYLQVKTVTFFSDRMPYIVLRGHYFNIIVLNAYAPSEDKSDDSKENFYEELQQVFDRLPKHRMKILLGDCNAKLGRVIFSNRQLGLRV
jgi:exonuclease III